MYVSSHPGASYDRQFVFLRKQTVPLCFPSDHNGRKCREQMIFILDHYGAYVSVQRGTCYTLHCPPSPLDAAATAAVLGCITLALLP